MTLISSVAAARAARAPRTGLGAARSGVGAGPRRATSIQVLGHDAAVGSAAGHLAQIDARLVRAAARGG